MSMIPSNRHLPKVNTSPLLQSINRPAFTKRWECLREGITSKGCSTFTMKQQDCCRVSQSETTNLSSLNPSVHEKAASSQVWCDNNCQYAFYNSASKLEVLALLLLGAVYTVCANVVDKSGKETTNIWPSTNNESHLPQGQSWQGRLIDSTSVFLPVLQTRVTRVSPVERLIIPNQNFWLSSILENT